MYPKTTFKDISFNISNYCISTCKYCGLSSSKKWNLRGEMDIKHIETFLTDPILKNLTTIHLTGGDPFLSSKLLSIVDIIKEYHSDVPVNAPTNALYPELINRLMKVIIKKLPQYRLNIGIEGHTKEIHESVRGRGSWYPMLDTIDKMKSLGVRMVGNITLYPENYKYIRETKALVDKLGMNFYLNFGRYSRRFGNETDGFRAYPNQKEIEREIEEAMKDVGWLKIRKQNERGWAILKAHWHSQKVHFNCLASIEGIDVMPDGTVMPCLMYLKDYRLGNVQELYPTKCPLSHIMNKPESRKIQERIYRGDCSADCPFTCQLRMDNLTIDGKKLRSNNE